jgi:hypothetical protein
MKKIFILLVVAGIIFAGCSDVKLNNVTQPEKASYKLVQIPGRTGLSSETAYTTTSIVDGSVGDTMTMNASYMGDNGQLVSLNMTMTIPAGAFTGVRTITLTADDQYAALSCSPSMVFDKSLNLDFSYTGLTLNNTNLPNGKHGFNYISDSGNLETVVSNGVLINRNLGRVVVTGAQINHFSRYGWTTIYGGSD